MRSNTAPELKNYATPEPKRRRKVVEHSAPNSILRYVNTSDYDKFHVIRGNRKLDERNVTRLVSAMKAEGNMSAILCWEQGGRYMVIDGQHRVEACKRLQIDVQVLVAREPMTPQQIASYNARQKKWNTQNYLSAKAEAGKDVAANFIMNEVETLSDELKTKFSPLCVWALLTGNEGLTSQLKKDIPIEIPKNAFHIYNQLRPKFVEILQAADDNLRITLKQVGVVQAVHDLLLDPDFDHVKFVALLKSGRRPALMNGARKKLENLRVLLQFYWNNVGVAETVRDEMKQRLGLDEQVQSSPPQSVGAEQPRELKFL